MEQNPKSPKIYILKDGPYLVTGKVSLSKKAVVPVGRSYKYQHLLDYTPSDGMALCRCGKSQNAPFCDGTHTAVHFDGTETATRENYCDRAEAFKGPGLTLLDDGRCALARFCHRDRGTVWDLVGNSDDPLTADEIIKASADCPAGRFEVLDRAGNIIEPYFDPGIEALLDQERKVSGPLFVKGKIPVESSDGFAYEVRNQAALCRCGASKNKPFCDATHALIGYRDDE